MIGDIIEIERAKRVMFETLETTPIQRPRDPAVTPASTKEADAPDSAFAALMASVREKLGQFKIRLD